MYDDVLHRAADKMIQLQYILFSALVYHLEYPFSELQIFITKSFVAVLSAVGGIKVNHADLSNGTVLHL